jgi:hypothetical protein
MTDKMKGNAVSYTLREPHEVLPLVRNHESDD